MLYLNTVYRAAGTIIKKISHVSVSSSKIQDLHISSMLFTLWSTLVLLHVTDYSLQEMLGRLQIISHVILQSATEGSLPRYVLMQCVLLCCMGTDSVSLSVLLALLTCTVLSLCHRFTHGLSPLITASTSLLPHQQKETTWRTQDDKHTFSSSMLCHTNTKSHSQTYRL